MGCSAVGHDAVCRRNGTRWGEVGSASALSRLAPAQEVESSAGQQYAQLLQLAKEKNALALKDHPQLRRLRAIAQKIIPFTQAWNPRARDWQWAVNLIGSNQINAFCMPGRKIAFYSGILTQLQLSDDEVAMVMGHEIAHALREHACERIANNAATPVKSRIADIEKNMPKVLPLYERA